MKMRTLLQVSLIGVLAMSITTNAHAYQISVEHQYYSDASFSTMVGIEWIPGICCPEDQYDYVDNVTTNYRIAIGYDECGWQGSNGGNCQEWSGTGWRGVQCP